MDNRQLAEGGERKRLLRGHSWFSVFGSASLVQRMYGRSCANVCVRTRVCVDARGLVGCFSSSVEAAAVRAAAPGRQRCGHLLCGPLRRLSDAELCEEPLKMNQ